MLVLQDRYGLSKKIRMISQVNDELILYPLQAAIDSRHEIPQHHQMILSAVVEALSEAVVYPEQTGNIADNLSPTYMKAFPKMRRPIVKPGETDPNARFDGKFVHMPISEFMANSEELLANLKTSYTERITAMEAGKDNWTLMPKNTPLGGYASRLKFFFELTFDISDMDVPVEAKGTKDMAIERAIRRWRRATARYMSPLAELTHLVFAECRKLIDFFAEVDPRWSADKARLDEAVTNMKLDATAGSSLGMFNVIKTGPRTWDDGVEVNELVTLLPTSMRPPEAVVQAQRCLLILSLIEQLTKPETLKSTSPMWILTPPEKAAVHVLDGWEASSPLNDLIFAGGAEVTDIRVRGPLAPYEVEYAGGIWQAWPPKGITVRVNPDKVEIPTQRTLIESQLVGPTDFTSTTWFPAEVLREWLAMNEVEWVNKLKRLKYDVKGGYVGSMKVYLDERRLPSTTELYPPYGWKDRDILLDGNTKPYTTKGLWIRQTYGPPMSPLSVPLYGGSYGEASTPKPGAPKPGAGEEITGEEA